jgi:dynein heavy chain
MTEIIEVIVQFERFLGPELIAVTGENEEFTSLKLCVKDLPGIFSALAFDVFNSSNYEMWESKMIEFREEVKRIESVAQVFITSSFQRLRFSSEGAFQLVQNFVSLKSRPIIHSIIEDRYSDILERYMKELDQLNFVFEESYHNPIGKCCSMLPPKSGSVGWALDLYYRAKRPILQFQKRDGYLESGIGITVRRRYLSFARSIEKYKESIYNSWIEEDCPLVTELLKCKIMHCAPDPDDEKSGSDKWSKSTTNRSKHVLNEPLPFFFVNFPADAFLCIEEAKRFSELGFTLPNNIIEIVVQSESYMT